MVTSSLNKNIQDVPYVYLGIVYLVNCNKKVDIQNQITSATHSINGSFLLWVSKLQCLNT